jgi:hypothetical protein
VLAGCGSSSSSSTTATSAGATAQAQIKKNWTEFFNPSTPASTRASLLQNGAQFAPVISAQSKSSLAKQSSAKVTDVKLTSPTSATVTYTILLAGKPVLPNTTGTAVKTNGTWQVSDASFCQLLKLEGGAPPGCPKS